MSNYRRDYVNGGTYFITVALQNRNCDWLVRHIDALRDAFRETMSHYPFEIIAITVLPEHFHLILRLPENTHDYSRIIQLIKINFTKRLPPHYRAPNPSKQRKREAGIWQRRFWEHRIRDERDLNQHIDYTYFNPVKHGYVVHAKDWLYSSFHRDVKRGLFEMNWGGVLPECNK